MQANQSKTHQLLIGIVLAILLYSQHSTADNLWTAQIQDNNGLPTIIKGGVAGLTSTFEFWGKDWEYAYFEPRFKIVSPGQYESTGYNQPLGFELLTKIAKTSNHAISWDIQLVAKEEVKNVVGGGIEFNFDLVIDQKLLGAPSILPDKSGWEWGKAQNRIEFRINPKPADLVFEPGTNNKIRAFFYNGKIAKGTTRFTAKLTLPEKISIAISPTERFGKSDLSKWTPNILDWQTSPVDLSFLNAPEKPAGKRGFVKAVNAQLIFEDGTVAKFWGTNLSAYSLFETTPEMVKKQAKRLSALGFNLVRLHHHDSLWVDDNIFGNRYKKNTKTINKSAMEKLDWWIKCLKDEGIYVWLDLHVERHFTPEDGITAFSEIKNAEGYAGLKGVNYVNASIKKAMQEFNAAYLQHTNQYTKTRYLDEPAIAAALITNENDITHHFGNGLLADKGVPYHTKIFMAKANQFAKQHKLPQDKVSRTWEHGPSKLFLNDLEHQFNSEMIQQLRELGLKIPIITTSTWGDNPLSSLPALTSGDMIDVHSYQNYGALEKNPLYASNITHWISAAQVLDKPISVTEWNTEPFPTADRHTLPLYIASQASLQGWDAMMQYAYAQNPLTSEDAPSNWGTYNDPASIASMPAAALMYRRGDLMPAKTTYVFNPGRDKLFNQAITPENSALIRTATELGKFSIALPETRELPWLQKSILPKNAKIITDPNVSLIPADAKEVSSDTGEIKRNWEKGYLTINSKKTQAATGWIGNETIRLDNIEIAITTPNASVSVQSLKNVPIAESTNILISLAARSLTEEEWQMPFLSEPVEGQLSVKAPENLKLYLLENGKKKRIIPVTYKNGWYSIKLQQNFQTYWLVLDK